jgi:hypothetical protein
MTLPRLQLLRPPLLRLPTGRCSHGCRLELNNAAGAAVAGALFGAILGALCFLHAIRFVLLNYLWCHWLFEATTHKHLTVITTLSSGSLIAVFHSFLT